MHKSAILLPPFAKTGILLFDCDNRHPSPPAEILKGDHLQSDPTREYIHEPGKSAHSAIPGKLLIGKGIVKEDYRQELRMETAANDSHPHNPELVEACTRLLTHYRGKGLKLWRVRNDIVAALAALEPDGAPGEGEENGVSRTESVCASLRRDLAEDLRLIEEMEAAISKARNSGKQAS
jgi:hypothetical protein